MTAQGLLDLRDLVDSPVETPQKEYKSWLDLSDKIVRAKIARHLIGLANHGGGYLIFGFNSDLSPDPNVPNDIKVHYNQDYLFGIVERYASPTFSCEVIVIESSKGSSHAIVSVPSHGEYPILTKNNGPEEEKRIIGVEKAKVYIRKPKPETAPITEPHEWIPIFDRCLVAKEIARATTQSAVHSETQTQPIGLTLAGFVSSTEKAYFGKLKK